MEKNIIYIMDITVIIIGLSVLAAFIVPTILVANAGKNKKNKFLKLITELADSKSSKIEAYDQWKHSCIGLDSEKHKVFCVQKNSSNYHKMEINLPDVLKCKLVGVNMTGNSISDSHKAIDEIKLNFSYRDAGKPETSIEFFKIQTDFTIVDEDLKLAEKWLRIVNTELANLVKKN